ncbi:xanthine dehydrogenase accessory protein XdhC [Arthrobacter crystallopoietes]|uniref:Molybdenum cofactor sulfurylase n=1 Tax=Crystallibacter crystallopoietes TaxID=37928 RepID=A0A1H1DDC8_9MICC|nr:xanthine dehydrogenase accessory protein XdhC [Arthrobacter crystallopoietes]AUI50358.1 xanthine dehydrogenase accessory protein XdhC [Arthrobacter crystallopoietes]SDQ74424.1 molybdenum cofactor sulfurylase [Arthrobacter crystallopoietes]
MDWLQALQDLRSAGLPSVLATVTEARGHAPREAGAKMVVGTEATWGSIGGGNLEATVIDRARARLRAGSTVPESLPFPLNEHAATEHGQQCCGGVVTVLLEPFPACATVAIFGMGHVGHELARILSRLPLQLHLVDSRAGQLDPTQLTDILGGPAEVHPQHSPVPDSILGTLPPGSHVFIMTHDHAEDFLLCDAALRRGNLGSVGLIGSSAKWSRFRQKLQAEGHDSHAIDTISCPIGLAGLPGKDPAAIAVSAAASLLPALSKHLAV